MTVAVNPPPVLENVTVSITGAAGDIVMVSVGAGLGVTSVPPALSVAVKVIVPATVPVASTGEFAKTALVPPIGMLNDTAETKPPPEVTNPTSVGFPPTDDAKLTVNVPVSATG